MPQKALKNTVESYDAQISDDPYLDQFLSASRSLELGRISSADCTEWLRTIPSQSVDLIFADPPYNIGKASWDAFETHELYLQWCLEWIAECARALKPSGSLFVCGFTEIIADLSGLARRSFSGLKWIIWHYKNKANLGSDFGRSHESLIHLRHKEFKLNIDPLRVPYGQHTLKYPEHPQAASSDFARPGKSYSWTPNPLGAKPRDVIEMPTTSNGMAEKTPHPTQKPEELLRKLIAACTRCGDLVIDPFSGSGTTAVCSEQLERRWAASDISDQYNRWAAHRLARIRVKDELYWADYDRRIVERRESIR